jgi:hypothetical protein
MQILFCSIRQRAAVANLLHQLRVVLVAVLHQLLVPGCNKKKVQIG